MKYMHMLGLAAAIALAGCSGENAERAAANTVSKAVELAKGVATGVDQGVEDGRKATPSADDARIVSTGDDLRQSLTGRILDVSGGEAGDTAVVLAFDNVSDVPVRVTRLSLNNNVVALDQEGFACANQQIEPEFTVPAKAKFKATWSFHCEGPLNLVRILGVEYTR